MKNVYYSLQILGCISLFQCMFIITHLILKFLQFDRRLNFVRNLYYYLQCRKALISYLTEGSDRNFVVWRISFLESEINIAVTFTWKWFLIVTFIYYWKMFLYKHILTSRWWYNKQIEFFVLNFLSFISNCKNFS